MKPLQNIWMYAVVLQLTLILTLVQASYPDPNQPFSPSVLFILVSFWFLQPHHFINNNFGTPRICIIHYRHGRYPKYWFLKFLVPRSRVGVPPSTSRLNSGAAIEQQMWSSNTNMYFQKMYSVVYKNLTFQKLLYQFNLKTTMRKYRKYIRPLPAYQLFQLHATFSESTSLSWLEGGLKPMSVLSTSPLCQPVKINWICFSIGDFCRLSTESGFQVLINSVRSVRQRGMHLCTLKKNLQE